MKVGDAGMKLARSRGEIVPKDFVAAVTGIKLAILQSRAGVAHASNVGLSQVQEILCLQND